MNKFTTIALSGLLSTALFSCSKEMEDSVVKDNEVVSTSARKASVDAKIELAKVMAKAVKNPEIRKLIRTEAIKKFDNDYDVLLQSVKNNKLSSGKVLLEAIADYADDKDRVKRIVDDLPLLTFFIPNYYSAEKWKEDDVPIIVVRNNDNKLIAISEKGEMVELSDKEQPYLPFIVVKMNDKVVTKNNLAGGRVNANDFIFSNNKGSFYFSDPAFNNINPRGKGARRVDLLNSDFDPLVVQAYYRALGCNYCAQRDWLYYGIDARSGIDRGPLNVKFQEAVTAFEPVNTGITQVIGGWDEGVYVFSLTPILGDRNASEVNANIKTIPVRPEDIYTYTERIEHYGIFGIYTRIIRDITGVKPYTFPVPVTFVNWDMEKYGDRWGLVLEEYDQTVTITKTFKNTVTFGANFTVTAGSKEKVGASLGASATTTKETTTVYQSQEGNDVVGNATIEWTTPILTHYAKNYVSLDPMAANSYEANTGSMRISFEAVRVAP